MNWKKTVLFIIGGLVIVLILFACGPSQAELNQTTTQAAVAMFATQTAEAPTVTEPSTKTPASTNTPSAREIAEEYFLNGVEFQEEMEWDQAIEQYSEAIAIDPDYAEAYINRGLCFYFCQ